MSDKDDIISFGICRYSNINGVTCYMNSILHILQQIPIFSDYIFNANFSEIIKEKMNNDEEKIKNTVSYELYRLFNVSRTRDDMTITPTSFRQCIGNKNDMWMENTYQDSQEFLNFLITSLEEEIGTTMEFIPGKFSNINNTLITNILAEMAWKNFQAKEYSPLKEMFNGMTMIQTKCNCCSNLSNNFEPFTTLQLPIPVNNNNILREFNLSDCFDSMTKEEQLDKDNLYNCDLCGIKNKAFKTSLIWRTPKILVIHLKRFITNENNRTRKIINNINYPLYDLDLSKYISDDSPYKNNSKYNLIGVNLHQEFSGFSINAGHYTSLVKNRMDNNWYLFNDGANPIKATKKEHIQNSNAYLLFYYKI